MFFNINRESLKNYPVHHQLMPNIILNCDQGWHKLDFGDRIVHLKGYCNKLNTTQLMKNVNVIPHLKGNFLAVIVDKPNDEIYIAHDTNRGTPIYLGDDYISNLEKGEPVWADCLLKIKPDFTVEKTYFNPYFVDSTAEYTDEEIIKLIHILLNETFEQFLAHNDLPLKIFLSGGIDTMLLYSYLDKFTDKYEIVDYEYIKLTHFYTQNKTKIKEYWAYKQIHMWDQPCVLVTGGNGDENFLRGPQTLEQVLNYYDTSIPLVCDNNPDGYHYKYFMKPKNLEIYEVLGNQLPITDFSKLQQIILNRNLNDFQHWHLDQTLTFTPFKDLDILQLVLKGSRDLIERQAADAYINKELIRLNDPEKLKMLSNYKNFDTFENFKIKEGELQFTCSNRNKR
jgi:hypothetical protein